MDILIYIINLESSLKRAESMRQKIGQLKGYRVFIDDILVLDSISNTNLRFYFFKAVDAKKIESGEIRVKNYNPILSKLFKGKILSNGEVACFSSHYALWQKCLMLNQPIVVLEDDVSFANNLEGLAKIYQSNFSYVRLMYLFNKGIDREIGDNFYINYDRVCGTQGYYLSPSGAKRFIAKAKHFIYCVDDYMDMSHIHKVPNIIYKPFLLSEDMQGTTIMGREKVRINILLKLSREICRIYQSLRAFFYRNFFAPKIDELKRLLKKDKNI